MESADVATDLMTYGATTCPKCRKVHPPTSQLKETWKSRFKLLRYAAEMMHSSRKKGEVSWTDQKTKAEKLAALRSLRNRLPLVDSRTAKLGGSDILKVVLDTLAQFESLGYRGLSAEDVHAAIYPMEYNSRGGTKGELSLDKFKNVLSQLEKTGNVRTTGSKPNIMYWKASVGGPARKIDDTLDDRNIHMLGALHEVADNLSGEFMLGLLVCPEKTFVSASGSGINNSSFTQVQKNIFKKYVPCKARTATKGTHATIRGTLIDRQLYASCTANGATPAGNCAAPRLLQKAFEDGDVDKGRFSEWAMSEIYFLPSTSTRTELQTGGLYWTHGKTAESCETCANLVPLLLCPS